MAVKRATAVTRTNAGRVATQADECLSSGRAARWSVCKGDRDVRRHERPRIT